MARTVKWGSLLAVVLGLGWPPPLASAEVLERDHSRISDQVIEPRVAEIPQRPQPVLELGDPLLGAGGPLNRGIELPTGEVLQPSLLVFGAYRTALQSYDDGDESYSQAVARLDLFANLQLSGTQRMLVGMRPLDQNGDFTSYNFTPPDSDRFEDHINGRITTLFFEGDLGEIFPRLDPDDSSGLDWGFSIGRQPLLFQEGLLIDDSIDSIGITRNTLLPSGAANLRITGLFGWNEIHRDDGREEGSVYLFGLFSEADFKPTTVSIDAAWLFDVDDETDGLYFGASAVQRIGRVNTAFRLVSSLPLEGHDTPEVSQGTLILAETSWVPTGTRDLLYANLFWGIGEFSSAARGPDSGEPLARAGLLFDSAGFGRFGAAVDGRSDDAVGGALGYQWILDGTRRQVVVESCWRKETTDRRRDLVGVGARFQQAFGRRTILRLDAFLAGGSSASSSSGLRTELVVKF